MSELYKDLPYTTFPDNIDNMPYFVNITAEDLPSINLFNYYIRMSDFNAAESTLKSVPDYDKKLIDSGKLNKFRDALIALERYYKNDVEPYIINKQSEWQGIMDEFSYSGVWNKTNSYDKNNIVSHVIGDGTYMYIATQDVPVNIDINNTNYWTLFTIKGDKGVSGDGGAFKYEYLDNVTYNINDIVSHNNCLWLANATVTGVEPTEENTSSWSLLLKIPPISAPLQTEEPTGLKTGDLWFQII